MAEFFVRRPIVAMVIAIIIVIVGITSLGALPVAPVPGDHPAGGAGHRQLHGRQRRGGGAVGSDTHRAEGERRENMLYMKSVNANDGSMRLTIAFEVGSDLDMSNVLVQNRVSEGTASACRKR